MKGIICAVAGVASGFLSQSTMSTTDRLSGTAVDCKSEKSAPISPAEFKSLTLINVHDESPDTKIFRFAFPDGNQTCPGELTHCFVFRYVESDGTEVTRPYTPTSALHNNGTVEFVIKSYKGSKMGSHLFNLKPGSIVDIKGPFANFSYKPGQYKAYGLIAAGTGITPMFQFIREVLNHKEKPNVSLIYANRRKEDVLLGPEINTLVNTHSHFSSHYVLSQPPSSWMGGVGHVTKEMIKTFMPPPSQKDIMLMVCGPSGFMESISGTKDYSTKPFSQGEVKGLLKDLGYHSGQIFKF